MKKVKFLILISLALVTMRCNSTKVLTINTHLAIVSATITNTFINRTPGALLQFVVTTNASTTLDSVIYWGIKNPLSITATNNDTIWAQARFVKPIPDRVISESEQSMSAIAPPDTTCFITYHYKEEFNQIKIPTLRLVNE